MNPRLYCFTGGNSGPWRVTRCQTLSGAPLADTAAITVLPGDDVLAREAAWVLRGVTSHERYVTRDEKSQLVARQPPLGRPEATCAALIPLRKNDAWWALPQDERRQIIEAQSAHIKTGMKYLPAIARRLHHCRDLTREEPFDFLTWFEFAPADASAFDALLGELRASPEWRYIDREIDIRLTRD